MGGCRCIFRNCVVGTARNPEMHFFRFPVRDPSRLMKWAKMSDNVDIVRLPLAQLKNKVVCARHFRDECFMNYMRNKLVASAVPTLDRLKDGYALDYDTNGNVPVMIELPPTTLPHMIPPKGFRCPLGLDDDIEILQANETLQEVEEVSSDECVLLENEDVLDVLPDPVVAVEKVEAPKVAMEKVEAPKLAMEKEVPKRLAFAAYKRKAPGQSPIKIKTPKILNFTVPEKISQHSIQEEMSFSMELQDDELEVLQQDSNSTSYNQANDDEIEIIQIINVKEQIDQVDSKATNPKLKNVCVEKGIQVTLDNVTRHNNERELENLQMQLQSESIKYATLERNMSQQVTQLQQALDQANCQIEILKIQLDQETDLKLENEALSLSNEQAKAEITSLLATQTQLSRCCEELKQKYDTVVVLKEELELKNHALRQQQQQVATVSTSKNSLASENSKSVLSSGTLTKAQIFNGIKKYLCSSMTALVRMEMFGSTDRTWKPDEKQAALDLFGLGENVYKYFTDEWRFRLPGLRQVKIWFSEAATAESLDDDEDL